MKLWPPLPITQASLDTVAKSQAECNVMNSQGRILDLTSSPAEGNIQGGPFGPKTEGKDIASYFRSELSKKSPKFYEDRPEHSQ